MKKLIALIITIIAFNAHAVQLDDFSGYNEYRSNSGMSSGSLTTTYIFPNGEKRVLETPSLRCSICFTSTEISSSKLKLNATQASGNTLFQGASLTYKNISWFGQEVLARIKLTSSATQFIETPNTSNPALPGARVRAIITTTTGTFTTLFYDFDPYGVSTIDNIPEILTNTIVSVRIEFWNINKLTTVGNVDTDYPL